MVRALEPRFRSLGYWDNFWWASLALVQVSLCSSCNPYSHCLSATKAINMISQGSLKSQKCDCLLSDNMHLLRSTEVAFASPRIGSNILKRGFDSWFSR